MPEQADAVAITGLGVLTPMADTLAQLDEAVRHGSSRIVDHDGRARSALVDFDPQRYANVRGMRVYPRSAQLQICAASLARAHAGLKIAPEQLGVISASTYAHLETLVTYDRDLVALGVERTNPTYMPLALPSSAGALTALALGARAFSITLSDGGGGGLSALALAARKLRGRRAQACVVVGSFALSEELERSAERAGWLVPRDAVRVFDRESRGSALGELAIAFVLELHAHALRRDRAPLALLAGHAAEFASAPARLAETLADVCQRALAVAGAGVHSLGLVSASANGQPRHDLAEAHALRSVLAEDPQVPVTAVKSMLGESFDASALLQTAIAIGAMRTGVVPPIVGLQTPVVPQLAFARGPVLVAARRALITSMSRSGSCSALVLKGQT